MWRAVTIFIVAFSLLAIGCNDSEETAYDEATGIYDVPDDDPEMDAAIAKAKASIDDFIGHLKSPQTGMDYFAVKKPYPTRGGTEEHIWVEVTEFRDNAFHGTIANEPRDIEGITLGSPVSVAKSEITDWLITTPSGNLGGYTVAVLEKRMAGG
jgi:uncharacterized protein YegJ (DUF2314 family)